MTDPAEPSRLLDSGSAAPEALRELLRGAARDVGTDAELALLGSRLGVMLTPLAAAAPPAAAQVGLSVAGKLGLSALGLLTAGGGFWWLTSSPGAEPVVPVTRAAVSGVPLVSAPSLVPKRAVPELERPVTEVGALPEPAKSTSRAVRAPAVSEAELLEEARGALGRDPGRALSRANEHARSYARGVLVQEREVIAIQALRQLGRTAEAERRAQAFVKAFPGSAFQRRLETAR